jgi:septum formation protein
MPMLPEIILASASPRRRELLLAEGWSVQVLPADIEEWEDHDANPVDLVRHNALEKARKVFLQLGKQSGHSWILGADTTVALADHVLNKPSDSDDARRMLNMLSGKEHSVYTAVAMIHGQSGLEDVWVEESRVRFRQLSSAQIDHYLSLVNVLDKAGAYAIQEQGDLIISGYSGSFSNIMGLPIERLREKLTPIA